jgi:hypothetical protein
MALAQNGACVVSIDICATVDPNSGVTPATRENLKKPGGWLKLWVTVGGTSCSINATLLPAKGGG